MDKASRTYGDIYYRLCEKHTSMFAGAVLWELDLNPTIERMIETAERYERHADDCSDCLCRKDVSDLPTAATDVRPATCPDCKGHGWLGSRHDQGPDWSHGGHYHCPCGATCAVMLAEGCTGARS